MMGMFQSSRIASGNPRLQTSSAFSPSSASRIRKSSPSRIRLATFRMTLESSTTRHVFISASASCRKSVPLQFEFAVRPFLILRRHGRRLDFENTVDIEDNHELAVEAMDPAGESGHSRVEIDGIVLAPID